MPDLILASLSAYKRELLERLEIPFRTVDPDEEEVELADEPATAMAARLAATKAAAVFRRFPRAWVLGSDQTAECGDVRLRKPGSHHRAAQQLRECSGRTVHFHSAIALLTPDQPQPQIRISSVAVTYRQLPESWIEDYLAREQPYDCLGSFKCEGLGIRLLERVESEDPTALIGLPLIAVCDLLTASGLLRG